MRSLSRAFALPVLVLFTLAVATPDALAAHHHRAKKSGHMASVSSGVSDPRYADLIMNSVTGEVYHAQDPDGRRYPASLTKMMTLYLLFEALEQHKTTMGAHLDISEYAASMPQTNLHLTPGDTIPVETAIKALVIRSANDVAVVVGEALGGDVDHFAQMMTAKAHSLGMKNTVFKNPNGLPNPEQHTTARDMAKLGIALKRDFPKYYPYFAVRQFSWDGATYYTHNRVMLRYAGTDGIKTGFIGASGFNLVTSVTRGGRPLVGVVMGGVSGGWRDNRMIALLDSTYETISTRGAARGKNYIENLPLKNGAPAGGIRADAVNSVPVDAPTLDENADTQDEASEEDTDKPALLPAKAEATTTVNNQPVKLTAQVAQTASGSAKPSSVPPAASASVKAPAQAPVQAAVPSTQAPVFNRPQVTPPTPPGVPVKPMPPGKIAAPSVEDATMPPVKSSFSYANESPPAVPAATKPTANNPWGIQVGAFSSKELADKAVSQSRSLAKGSLDSSVTAIAGPESNGSPVYRARLTNLTEKQAKIACEQLIANNSPCFIYKAGN